MICLKADGIVTNSLDADQTPHVMASDLGLYCSRLSVQVLTVNTVPYIL